MPPRTTTSPSPTSTKASSRRRAKPTRKRSKSSRTTRSSNRITSCSRKSMTARLARTLCSGFAVLLTVLLTACSSYYEIPIETPIRPKLDVSAFQRVLVAGFIAGGTEDVDGNLETTRLLRSQLRTRSELRVIDADVLPLMEVATDGRTEERPAAEADAPANGANAAAETSGPIKEDKDLEAYEHVFADVEYWKRIGEEYQQPLIVTGSVMFAPQARSGI